MFQPRGTADASNPTMPDGPKEVTLIPPQIAFQVAEEPNRGESDVRFDDGFQRTSASPTRLRHWTERSRNSSSIAQRINLVSTRLSFRRKPVGVDCHPIDRPL